MGYQTKFTLRAFNINSIGNELEIGKKLALEPNLLDPAKYNFVGYSINEYGESLEPVNWYDYEDDMIKFSKENPGILFQLNGIGEGEGDYWVTYFLNGNPCYCKGEVKVIYGPIRWEELSKNHLIKI